MTALLDTASASMDFSPVLKQILCLDYEHSLTDQQHLPKTWSPYNDDSCAENDTQDYSCLDFQLLDSFSAHERELQRKFTTLSETFKAYDDRILELVELAYNDGYSLNSGSKETFQNFIKNNLSIRLGQLVLLENGNLRSVWKGDNNAHIGLQFLENGQIQYVLFKRRQPGLPVSRVHGRDSTDGVLKQIVALDLKEVMYFV